MSERPQSVEEKSGCASTISRRRAVGRVREVYSRHAEPLAPPRVTGSWTDNASWNESCDFPAALKKMNTNELIASKTAYLSPTISHTMPVFIPPPIAVSSALSPVVNVVAF